ncbi:MAG: DUF3467 domain-containing protein [Thermoleophilia bacterium]|jgi:hypothetical protein|nr:DUF3467 domain-containing protein [Actinomycetota bacterium]MCL6093815.1 DUF3467 domain-containing protein [Actinomycetota bacterium]MDA8166239.1 DUF3467 domain-containing protein [Actinomycetota bacterium]
MNEPTNGGNGDPAAPRGPQVKVNVPPEIQRGVYANMARVNHSEFEFSIDFANADFAGQDHEGNIPAVVVARLMISHEFMPHLLDALQENFSRFLTRRDIEGLPETEDPS